MAGIVGLTEIQHQNGTSAMAISAGGLVTKPQLPFFHVIRSNSGGSISINGIITFDSSPTTNQGNHWNTSGNYFLVPVAGVYQFNFSAIGAGASATTVPVGGEVQVLLEKSTNSGGSYSEIVNGAYHYTGSGATLLPNITFSASVLLAQNDRIRINVNKGYVYVSTLANKYTVTFTGHLVG
tara:strand:- start:432 stop:974 length:543 start_codon:yes stop_codon:yes gene_type:complete